MRTLLDKWPGPWRRTQLKKQEKTKKNVYHPALLPSSITPVAKPVHISEDLKIDPVPWQTLIFHRDLKRTQAETGVQNQLREIPVLVWIYLHKLNLTPRSALPATKSKPPIPRMKLNRSVSMANAMMASAKQMTRSRKPTRYVAAAALPQAEIRRKIH